MTTIDCFQDENGVHLPLSNFSPSQIMLDGNVYETVEHRYQAMKAREWDDHEHIRTSPSPGEAKRRGRRVKIRSDWEEIKLPVMRDALVAKFGLWTSAGAYLLDTGTALLVEGNTWGDRFWGQVHGQGSNWLGVLLMARRAELVAEKETGVTKMLEALRNEDD